MNEPLSTGDTNVHDILVKISAEWQKTPPEQKAQAKELVDLGIVGTSTSTLQSLDSDALRDRYWHLWLCNNPHFGIPVSWRAPLDKSPMARKIRNVRKNEMLRIERIIKTDRQEDLHAGQKYDEIFEKEVKILDDLEKTLNRNVSVKPTADHVPA